MPVRLLTVLKTVLELAYRIDVSSNDGAVGGAIRKSAPSIEIPTTELLQTSVGTKSTLGARPYGG